MSESAFVRLCVRACRPVRAPAQKMRNGKFSVKEEVASPRGIVEACVRAVQPAVPVPIEVIVEAGVPDWVRAPAARGATAAHSRS